MELTEDATADSWVGGLLGEAAAAGVHVLRVRDFTAGEIDEIQACEDAATNPDLECPALKMHVSLAADSIVTLVAGDQRPDLS